jgi:meso-butanediol dehydrogenase/(S,S)-butanediol dehydrogenase/diacetyl reductase
MSGRLAGKTIVITGAGSGLGAGIAAATAAEGANVVVTDLDAERAASVAADITKSGSTAIDLAVDATEREQVRGAIDRAVSEFGELNVWFNVAGAMLPSNFLEITQENWDWTIRTNAWSCLVGIQEAAKQMISQGTGGKIVNTGSAGSYQGYPTFAPYSCAKSSVVMLTEAAAKDLATHKITVNGFHPGVFDTPGWYPIEKGYQKLGLTQADGEGLAAAASGVLLGRAGTTDDLAGTAIFLASPDSDYITGQLIRVDGGIFGAPAK